MAEDKASPHQSLLTELPEAGRQRALERFRILRPFLEDGVPLARIAINQKMTLRTAQRWVARYRQDGLVGLARQPRTDRGQRRIQPELKRLVEGLALGKPPPSTTFVHRQVNQIALQQGWPTLSYACVHSILHNLDPALITMAHDGPKAYREEFDLIHRREANRPNDIWQADHTLLDIWLSNERGQPARPWLTAIIDDYSRVVPGYFLGFGHPSALITSLALRQAIWRKEDHRWHVCGIPEVFYTDHGSDFTSKHLEQVSADLKMQLVFSTAGIPRGRGKMERFFATVNQLFLCRLPGYAPAGSGPVKPKLTLGELEDQFREFLLTEYHQRVHSGTGLAPQDRWEAGGFLPRMPESLEHLDLLLLTVAKARRVHQDGIHFQGLHYLDLTLAAYVGQDVTIRYDPRDLAEIRVYYRDAFLCRAICPELAGQTIGIKDIIRARDERRKTLRGEIKDHQALIEQYLAVHREEPPPALPDSDQSTPKPKLKRYYNE
jgi:putative transposase